MYHSDKTMSCDGCHRKFKNGEKVYEAVQTAHELCGACARETTTQPVRVWSESYTGPARRP